MSDSDNFQPRKRAYTRLMDRYRGDPFYSPVFNRLVRSGLRLKVLGDEFRLKLVKRSDEEIDQWYSDHNVFFGFALYRSGTFFLSNFLNHILEDAQVEHEANVNDYWYYSRALQSEDAALRYVQEFRKADLVRFASAQNKTDYGEINPFLRRHCKALQLEIPNAKYFHLVRDGREVVRSIMSREILDVTDPLGHLTFPPKSDPYRSEWNGMSRFEKICWMWQADNRYIREATGHTMQFEKLRTDYDYFNEKLLGFLDLEIAEPTWSEYMSKKRNSTPRYTFPHWNKWDEKQRSDFERICGEEMTANGYF